MKPKNMHLSEGEIRGYQDKELSVDQSRRAEAHLASCQTCQAKAAELSLRAQRVAEQFSHLESAAAAFTTLPAARRRLAERLEQEKEKPIMQPKTFLHIPRAAWVALTIIAVLAVSLTFAPVRALANNFLALFRVEQIRVVQFDPSKMPEKLESSSQLEYILSNDVQVESGGEPQEVASAEKASALAGFPLRLPSEIEGRRNFLVQPKTSLTFTINLELVRGVLKDLERTDIQLPDNLDGAVVHLEIPTSVAAQYGNCSYDLEPEQIDPDNSSPVKPDPEDCTTLFQVPSPQISAPPEFELSKIGEAYLQVLGMSPQEAASFASSVDWTTTFIIPLPRYGADYKEVDLNGTPATIIMEHGGWSKHYMLLWVKDGFVYGLSGPGDQATALKIARSIE